MYGLWQNQTFAQTSVLILLSLVGLFVLTFFLKRFGPPYTSAWASLKSWLFVAPLMLACFAAPDPWPLVLLTWAGVLSAKSFFQMVGMYHRSWFIWVTYIFIYLMGYIVHTGHDEYYNVMPMIFLGVICLIPLLRNSATHMIQYIALSLLAFIFWGWSFMHLGRLLTIEGGALLVLYLYVLTEVSENVSWAVSKLVGRMKPFSKISSKVTVEGMVVAIVVTMFLAWGLRHLLPDRSDQFWVASGLTAAIFGRMGDLILSVIRRDLGIKNTGIFIMGRDGVLTRVDKLIFVGPMYFYIYTYLQQNPLPIFTP